MPPSPPLALCPGGWRMPSVPLALARVEPALTGRPASGTHCIQMFGIRTRAGRLANCPALTRVLGRRRRVPVDRRPAFRRAPGRAVDGRTRLAAYSSTCAKRGFERLALPRCGWRRSPISRTLHCDRPADSELCGGPLVYELVPVCRGQLGSWSGVACYSARDRFLVLLATHAGRARPGAIEHISNMH